MQRIEIHEATPNPREIRHAAERLTAGAVIAYPTDTVYGLGVDMTNRRAVEKLCAVKALPKNHPFTFLCTDLSEVACYAVVSNSTYRILKRVLPGPYTFILEAARGVPHMLLNKRRTIGVRIPNHEVPLALCRALGHPIISTSATGAEGEALGDPDLIAERYGHGLDLLLDAGSINAEVSTVISLVGDIPEVIRQGRGSVDEVL